MRQAHAYFAAAVPVQDSSAALLYYYASLNLGKAELLTTNPHAIYQCTVHHGLSYSPGSSALPMTARLKVKPGVFRLLLDKRVGTQTPANQSLAVGRLMPRATENYTRLEDESWSESRLARVHHSVGWDATHIWSSVATPSAEVFLDHPSNSTTVERRADRDLFPRFGRSGISDIASILAVALLPVAGAFAAADSRTRKRD